MLITALPSIICTHKTQSSDADITAFVMSWILAVTLSLFEQAASVGAQIKVFNYCSKLLHLIFPSRIFKTSPVMKFALKIQSDRSELKCHCETYVEQLFIISEVFWNNRFGSQSLSLSLSLFFVCFLCFFSFFLTSWMIRTWTWVCVLTWGLIFETMLPVRSTCIQRSKRQSFRSLFLSLSGTTASWKSATNYADHPAQSCPNSLIPKAQLGVT
jgi:hypothetical protein